MKLPQIHLRDLLWLTLLVAALVGWWIDRQKLQEDAALEVGAIKQRLLEERTAHRRSEQELIDRWFAGRPARDN